MGFIFGGDTEWTYEQLQNKKKIADQLREGALTTPRNVGEGLAAIGKALGARGIDKRAGKREGELRSEFDSQFASLLGGSPPQQQSAPIGGGVSPAVGSAPISQGPIYTPADNPQGLDQSIVDSVNAANAPQTNPYADAIAAVESRGSGDYEALGPIMTTGSYKGDRAYGRYQIMGRNIPEWSKKHLGREISVEEFMANPQLQDQIFNGEFGSYVERYGNPQDAASVWFTGRPLSEGGSRTDGYISGNEYVNRFTEALGSGGGQPVMSAQNSPMQAAPAPVQGGGPDMQQIMALMSNPMATPAQKAYLGALMQQQMAAQAPADPMDAIELEMAQLELERARNPQADPGYTMLTPDQVASIPGLDPNKAYQAGPDGKISAIGGGGVTVNTGSTGPAMGTIPQGYTAIEDPSVEAGYRLVPIPGGPEDTTEADENKETLTNRSADIVMEDIDRALGIVENNPAFTTGIGAMLANVPGTEARSLKSLLTTITANVGFDRLQQMREASPTGGALGAVSERELSTLQAVLGNLEQSNNAEDLARNLQRLNDVYLEIIHGPGGQTAVPETGAPVQIQTDADYDALPSGATFIDPEGVTRRKP